MLDLHIVDRFDEIEESFAALGVVGDVFRRSVSVADDGVIV